VTSGQTSCGVSGTDGLSARRSARTYALASAAATTELLSILRYRISSEYTAVMPFDIAAPVMANRALSEDYNVVALAAPAIAAQAAPGQFVMVKAGNSFDPLLRRPFSVFEIVRDRQGAAAGISLLSKRIGPSTRLIYDAAPGQTIACLGPLGRPFTVVDPPTQAYMIAGGVGLAPFWTLAGALRARGVRCTLFYGARTASELFYLEFFRTLGVELVLTTEDGSAGEHGRVVAPLDRTLASQPPSSRLM